MLRAKLHAKFLVLILGSLVVFLGILSYIIIQREARLLIEKGSEKQHLLAFAIYSDLRANMMKGAPRSTLEMMKSIRGTHGLVRLAVLRKDGAPAFGSGESRTAVPRIEDVFAQGAEISFEEQGDVPLHTILFPLKNERDCRTCHPASGAVLGALVISLSRQNMLREIRTSSRRLALSLAVLVALIGGVLYLGIRTMVLRPLMALSDGAGRIGNGDVAHRITVSTQDELEDLAAAFNDMACRLEESYTGLEHKIRERTAQLHRAMDEIQDKARRLYVRGRDMAAISRLSTKIFNAKLSLDELVDRFMWGMTRGLGYRHVLLCLVDRKRVKLEVTRNHGMDDFFPADGWPLACNDPFVSLVRSGKVTVLSGRDRETRGIGRVNGADPPPDIYVVPLLNRTDKKTCRELRSCIKTECPSYHEQNIPCWLMEQTLCGNPLVESYEDKFAYCMTCQVFPVIGVIIVAAAPRMRPSRGRNISLLRILASETAAALENHRLHEANQQMVRELLELHRITAAALSDLSLTKALDVFAESASKFPGADACAFWLISPDGRELVRKAGGCIDGREIAEICPERLPASEGLIGNALRDRNMFVVDYRVAQNDRTPLGQAAAVQGLPSLLAVPLRSESGYLGVFSVHKRSAMPFLETEIAAFMLLANQAAMAINVCILNEELKSHNRELARHAGLLSGILSSMSSGIMLLDKDTNVTLVNDVGAEILRSRRDDLLNRRLASLFPETAAFVRSAVGPYQELDIRLGEGTTLPIGFSTTYFHGASGEPEGIIVVYRDLSEIKSLQAELLSKERFAAMGRVVAGVAHEIRNPIFGISSIGQIFERELHSPAHLELVRALLLETKKIKQLVDELLLYGMPLKLNREDCDLTQIVREVIGIHRDELDRRGIRFSDDLGAGQVTAYLDANQIRQVFVNLLRNALDATPQGGEIRLRLLLEDRNIVFQIADTGVGIPESNLDKIFDLFFTTKPKGTGLGLAICKKIVQDHGGTITVGSEEGKGTAITIKLPYRRVTGTHEA